MKHRLNSSTYKAYSFIRNRIVSGEYASGCLLPAQDLSLEIGVSRTPVRDALRVLEQEGLVELNPRQESRVKTLTYEEFREMYEVRIALEGYFAGMAAGRRTPEDVESLQTSLETMNSIAREMDKAAATEKKAMMRKLAHEDIHYHMLIAESARNQLLKQELNRLHILTRIIITRHDEKGESLEGEQLKQNLDEVWNAHRRIFEGIRDGNAPEAREAMEAHLRFGMKMHLETKRRLDAAGLVPLA